MESSAGDDASSTVWDDTCFNAMFSGVSLQSFLAGGSQSHTFLPSLFGGGYTADALAFPDGTTSFYPQPSSNFVAECTASSDGYFLKLPKSEPMNVYGNTETEETAFGLHDSMSFPHLPDLRSLEQCSSSFNKRARVDYSMLNPSQMVEPMVRGCEGFQKFFMPYQYKPSSDLITTSATVSPTVQIPRSALARQRRQKLSDKTRCLQKLLPWDKKMDIATMLEEACKYVKFLQAQLVALQSMPCESAISTYSSNHYITGVFGGLERLNRNQLLQVLVNSPVAQTMLCSQSCCVFSAEQLGLIQKIAEKRVLLQQMSTFRPKP
ncbi:transcription factor bHLH117 [Benincasa hispida]|uniref:transcription factor bHLH117 n=1 Tax=Benincasa hispida TaxID=102211 RepID=UPI0019023D13|nr:transcription factor bHLH117 [Benincasa hispida]